MRTSSRAPLCYSPLPIEEYVASTVEHCEVRSIMALEVVVPAWNLFWLSTPSIDKVPGSGPAWFRHHQPNARATAALITDVLGDEALLRKASMHPSRFYEWWERQDHSIFDTYYILGDAWVQTVLDRTARAIARIAETVLQQDGNIFYPRFGGQVA